MKEEEAKALINKYQRGELTPEQEVRLHEWYLINAAQSKDELTEDQMEYTVDLVRSRLPLQEPLRRRLWPRIAGVAAAVAMIVFGVWLFNSESGALKQVGGDAVYKNDVPPGGEGATLTLASGKKIRLSDAVNGELAKEAGISISKTADGKLIYEVASSPNASRNDGEGERTNTLSTAKGETYQIRLPDGSRVWLNAASSLTYTANLIENGQRRIKLQGEGYFEVFKDKKHPFIVETDKQEVEVLGTHFNVNSYADEPLVKTTLLEGSVQVIRDGQRQVLKPGEQALNSGTAIQIRQANVGEATAWKNGDFQFDDKKMSSIVKELERWYNVEIVLGDDLADEKFTGKISRSRNISRVLSMMEKTNSIQFKIEGRRITAIEK